jgi:hypothetical protein
MFVQHLSPLSPVPSTSIVKKSEDFELIILTKSTTKITGTLQFQYLNQSFNAHIVITPSTIKIQAAQSSQGINLHAPIIPNTEVTENNYLLNGALTKQGHQNIVWLLLDFIHLYNLLRLKPNAIGAIYREAFSQFKTIQPAIVFGKVIANTEIANTFSAILIQKWKRNFKYQFGNPLDLLNCVENIIAHYPLQLNKHNNILEDLNTHSVYLNTLS